MGLRLGAMPSTLRVLLSVGLSIFGSLCLYLFFVQRSIPDERNEICPPSTQLDEGSSCCLGDIERLNGRISAKLVQLLGTSFFRYYKINLNRPCPFWKEDMVCTSQGCAIDTLPKDPNGWEAKLSDIHFPTFQLAGTIFRAWEYDDDDFCLLDGEGESGVYVDLIENPERFTGYAGPSANKVWQSIYQENCFRDEAAERQSISAIWNKCVERQAFYRVVSGLHASISVHLSDKFYNLRLKSWESNFDLFYERVGKHEDRLRNMYNLYLLLFEAVSRITPRILKTMTFNHEDTRDDAHIKDLLTEIVDQEAAKRLKTPGVALFSPKTRIDVIEEFKEHFRNVTRIMDCVSCERCRLWGKIQTTGVGTALKVLFLSGQREGWDETEFRRSEVIALFNAFGRLSESIDAVERFRKAYASTTKDYSLLEAAFFRGDFSSVSWVPSLILSLGISLLGLSFFIAAKKI